MMELFGDPATWLPFAFAALMGAAILTYVILDGFDLGVGLLFPFATPAERDRMVASIGPFWDANETWLVLAIGILLVAFPVAHGVILTALYLPVAVLLVGLIARGVAFEFRVKAPTRHRGAWNRAFYGGSLAASLAQGFMLGLYVTGLQLGWANIAFAALTAVCLTVGFSFIGAVWLIGKTEGDLQLKAIHWARRGIWGMIAGIGAVSAATPLVSGRIWDRWFSFPEVVLLSPLPVISVLLVVLLWRILQRMPFENDRWAWAPFSISTVLFVMAFGGLAYSFYPYVVPEQITIYEAAAAPESLIIILVGALFVLPIIIGYSILAYTVFRGKATELSYY
ncbi:cytochrome bd-I ubiquinol oxidase subunit 2 apoprotein [Paracoccus tibetensis]|uniref:Cytochrome bd-I ubiquinol oxidase subunit 2 apoprotein n=2 Tax=Paracoccus tibetensis TaxID=336292 RepID=A0A1G5FMA4_9RHOB|nr:cytochrome bd-I ubiquinol oxidase subunit 2 apoprotein [Paracoccus tibetensis]